MALVVPACDLDIDTTGSLSYTNNGQVRCDGPGATLAWVELDPDTLGDGIMQPLSIADGLLITAAIILCWTVGLIGRMFIHTITKTRYM